MDVSVNLWKIYGKMDPVSLENLLFEVTSFLPFVSQSSENKPTAWGSTSIFTSKIGECYSSSYCGVAYFPVPYNLKYLFLQCPILQSILVNL